MQNLFGSSRSTDPGQAAGRRLESRAKVKMTQRQNIDILGWNIENVSNYLRGMLTYSTVILKNCVTILSVACIVSYSFTIRSAQTDLWVINQKHFGLYLLVFHQIYMFKCDSAPRHIYRNVYI